MRNLSVISKSPSGRTYRNDNNNKSLDKPSGVIRPATSGNFLNVQKSDLRAKLYSPEAEAEARKIAAENAAKREPFDLVAFREFVASHPIFSKLHLAVGEDEEE